MHARTIGFVAGAIAALGLLLSPAIAQVAPTPAVSTDDGSARRLFPLAEGNSWRFASGTTTREIRVKGAVAPYYLVEGIAAEPIWMFQSARTEYRTRIYAWNSGERSWSTLIDLSKSWEDQAGAADLTPRPCDAVTTVLDRKGFDELTRIGVLGKSREYRFGYWQIEGETCHAMIEIAGLDLAAGVGPARMRLQDGRVLDLVAATVGGRRYGPSSVGLDPRALANERLRAQLERASAGLLYPSESDFPFEVAFLSRGGTGPRLTPAEIARRLGHVAVAPVREVGFDAFFARLTDQSSWGGAIDADEARRFRELHTLLSAELTDLRVIRVGDPTHAPEMFGVIDVYILGRTRTGDLVGVRTRTVET